MVVQVQSSTSSWGRILNDNVLNNMGIAIKSSLSNTEYSQVAFVFDGSKRVKSYVNGKLNVETSYSSVLRLNDLFDSLLDSNIDDVQIYNRALSDAEITTLYSGKEETKVTPDSSSYTKIANDGSELPNSATLGTNPKDWACTKDNKTGLIWEVKTDNGGLRDKDNIYTNYTVDYPSDWDVGKLGDSTNTDGFVGAVNTQGLCGASDWRMPRKDELEGLISCSDEKYNTLGKDEYGQICTGSPIYPTINTTYFPNTENAIFWSSSPYAGYSGMAAGVHFYGGLAYQYGKNNDHYVRLVRDGTAPAIVPEETGAVDLSVAITKPAAVTVNKKATYKITVTNNSEFTATGVKAYFVIPGKTLVTVVTPKNCKSQGRIIECTWSDLAAKKKAMQAFSMTVFKKGALNVGAGVSANEDDTNEDNNETSAVISVK